MIRISMVTIFLKRPLTYFVVTNLLGNDSNLRGVALTSQECGQFCYSITYHLVRFVGPHNGIHGHLVAIGVNMSTNSKTIMHQWTLHANHSCLAWSAMSMCYLLAILPTTFVALPLSLPNNMLIIYIPSFLAFKLLGTLRGFLIFYAALRLTNWKLLYITRDRFKSS